MPTIDEILSVAEQARDSEWESHLNCGAINRTIAQAIEDEFGIHVSVKEGQVVANQFHPFGEEHAFVIIHGEHLNQSSGPLLVDGALDQFCEENKKKGLVSVSLGQREKFNLVDTIIPQDDLYKHIHW